MPYLILKDALKFMDFMKAAFDATEKMKHMRDENTLMHGEIQIGDSTIMFAEASEQFGSQPAGLFVYVDNADERYKKALAAGATSIMEPADQEYGRSCGVQDAYGNTWWITSIKK